MDTTPSPDSVTETVEASAAVSVPCLLNGLPQDAHQYIHALEERLRVLENSLAQNAKRTKAMGTMIFKNPATKMLLAAFPKNMQEELKEMFGGESNAVTEKNNGNGNS